MCSKDASQGQREKSLVLSMGGIPAQICTETFPHTPTNIDRGRKRYCQGKKEPTMKCVCGGSSLLLEGLTPTGETCLQEQR